MKIELLAAPGSGKTYILKSIDISDVQKIYSDDVTESTAEKLGVLRSALINAMSIMGFLKYIAVQNNSFKVNIKCFKIYLKYLYLCKQKKELDKNIIYDQGVFQIICSLALRLDLHKNVKFLTFLVSKITYLNMYVILSYKVNPDLVAQRLYSRHDGKSYLDGCPIDVIRKETIEFEKCQDILTGILIKKNVKVICAMNQNDLIRSIKTLTGIRHYD